MRRRTLHVAFASLGALAAGLAALGLVELRRLERTERAVAAVPPALSADEARALEDGDAPPRVRLARAVSLAAGGELDLAERALVELASAHAGEPLGRAALFDLGNAYQRAAVAAADDVNRSRTLLELAKQRYRDLLREDPDDWDARYNLERALRLAPEGDASGDGDRSEPLKSVDVIVLDFEQRPLP